MHTARGELDFHHCAVTAHDLSEGGSPSFRISYLHENPYILTVYLPITHVRYKSPPTMVEVRPYRSTPGWDLTLLVVGGDLTAQAQRLTMVRVATAVMRGMFHPRLLLQTRHPSFLES